MENEIVQATQSIKLMIGNVPNIDQYVFEVIKLNIFTLGVLFGIWKIFAKNTKTKIDDQIINLLSGSLSKTDKKEIETKDIDNNSNNKI